MRMDLKLTHKAVHWPLVSMDGYGKPTFGPAVEIWCFWRDGQEAFVDDKGRDQLSTAIVHVSEDLALGGYLFWGAEEDLDSSHGNPLEVPEAREIKKVAKVQSIRGDEYVRRVLLR